MSEDAGGRRQAAGGGMRDAASASRILPPASRFDVVSLGESMLRLSVPSGRRLDDTRSLELEIGGAESNVCTAMARLGRRAAWVGRLPDNALAGSVLRALRADGVDVSAARLAPGERLGTYFIEYAAAPRSIQVVYDRAGSAAANMTPDDVDWGYLLDTRLLHLTGITAALSEGCYAVVAEAVRRARAAGVMVSFDVNYRAKLWDTATAGERLRPLVAEADILFCKSADAAALFGCAGEPGEQMRALQRLTRAASVYCTFGERGAALLQGDQLTSQPATPVQIIDRIGSGDAFAAGALDGCLDGDPADGLRRGVALAAIALTQHGDRVLTSRAELAAVMAQRPPDVAR
ncbi:sugar kinase [Oscillochloris sp. ZM17-4]|uniref:sugar kinase n=1 Tax=Oscillochloris sp. ZM17-4 TaxID=2866714 RepID=UPI001C738D37|nr:sugar kinase [Oscillochloris sp. ZM17-4]MBX0328858.1 sugar kinase [Oscillochloris sp. ZM17-4]